MGICLLNLDILLQCCRKAAAVFIYMRNYLQINILSVCKGCSLPSSSQHGTLYNIDTWWRVSSLYTCPHFTIMTYDGMSTLYTCPLSRILTHDGVSTLYTCPHFTRVHSLQYWHMMACPQYSPRRPRVSSGDLGAHLVPWDTRHRAISWRHTGTQTQVSVISNHLDGTWVNYSQKHEKWSKSGGLFLSIHIFMYPIDIFWRSIHYFQTFSPLYMILIQACP